MSGFKSGEAACLLVQVSSASEDSLHRHCARCKAPRRFVHSGKFRLNAQKKRIDAWLIFRCTACGDRWKWPIHERRPVTAIDPMELDALMRNDPDLAARHAQAALRQSRPEGAWQQDTARSVALAVLEPATADTSSIEIVLAIAGAGLRLDRLLAQGAEAGPRRDRGPRPSGCNFCRACGAKGAAATGRRRSAHPDRSQRLPRGDGDPATPEV